MKAKPGDQIRVKGHHVGQPERRGRIVEVRGVDGGPPYLVRWDGADHDALVFPGGDAVIEEPDTASAVAMS
jgi:hypothetical protein